MIDDISMIACPSSIEKFIFPYLFSSIWIYSNSSFISTLHRWRGLKLGLRVSLISNTYLKVLSSFKRAIPLEPLRIHRLCFSFHVSKDAHAFASGF